jgi:hypothetical protein
MGDGRAKGEGQPAGQDKGREADGHPDHHALLGLGPGGTGGRAEIGGEPVLDGFQLIDALRREAEPGRGVGEGERGAGGRVENEAAQAIDLPGRGCGLAGVEQGGLRRLGAEPEQGLVGGLAGTETREAFVAGEIDPAGAEDRRGGGPLLARQLLQSEE